MTKVRMTMEVLGIEKRVKWRKEMRRMKKMRPPTITSTLRS